MMTIKPSNQTRKEMKNTFKITCIFLLAGTFFSCDNEIDINSLSDFSPGIASLSPADGGKVVQGDFNIIVAFADGTNSPLASVDLTLTNSAGDVLLSTSKPLAGTMDSLIVEGSEFGAASLEVGTYEMHMVIIDSKGQATDLTTSFEISKLPFPANHDEMYIAGSFNGWTWDSLELVAEHTWKIENIEMDGGPFKFKNTKDWADQDWGDSDCNGVMEVTTGGGPDTDCGYSGLVNVTFNDETLNYTMELAITLEANLESLYLLGSFNNFQGEDYEFTQTEDHTWALDEITLKPGDAFKFSEGPFSGRSFGDIEGDSIADESSPNIIMPGDIQEAVYTITFNDETLVYTITFVRSLFPENLYLVGGSTAADWDPSNSIPFVKTGDGTFEVYSYLTVAGDGFKLLEVQDWAGDWGEDPDNKDSLLQEGENNLTVASDGFYRINVDFVDGTFSVTESNWGIIGSATPNGWDSDTDMALVSETKGIYTWTIDVALTDGEMKFRENDAWDVDYGDNEDDGIPDFKGANIAVSAGTYTVQLVLDPVNGYSYSIE